MGNKIVKDKGIFIDEEFITIEQIQKSNKEEIKMICGFIENETQILFIQNYVKEEFRHIVDKILFKCF